MGEQLSHPFIFSWLQSLLTGIFKPNKSHPQSENVLQWFSIDIRVDFSFASQSSEIDFKK